MEAGASRLAPLYSQWAELARLSTKGKQIIVANSDHGIPEEAPAAIVIAVQDVVMQVRQSQK
jgi:hypothetical protein